jgi:hypothetical protein
VVNDAVLVSTFMATWLSVTAAIAHFWLRPWFVRQMRGARPLTNGHGQALNGERMWRFSLGGALAGVAVVSVVTLWIARPDGVIGAVAFAPAFAVGLWMMIRSLPLHDPARGLAAADPRRRRWWLIGLVALWAGASALGGLLAYLYLSRRLSSPAAAGLIAVFIGLVIGQIAMLVARVVIALALGSR